MYRMLVTRLAAKGNISLNCDKSGLEKTNNTKKSSGMWTGNHSGYVSWNLDLDETKDLIWNGIMNATREKDGILVGQWQSGYLRTCCHHVEASYTLNFKYCVFFDSGFRIIVINSIWDPFQNSPESFPVYALDYLFHKNSI